MSQINGGEISYGRTVKTGDYENKRCDVKVSFSVGDGEDHGDVVALAGKIAHSKAHELLGLQATSAAAVEPAAPAKPRGRPKVEAPTPSAPAAPPAADPAAIPEPVQAASTPAQPAAPVVPPAADPAAMGEDVLTAAPAGPTLTEQDCVTAVTSHNAKIKNPQAIKALLAEYVTHPKGVRDVPANMRQQFIDRLHKIESGTKPEDVKALK